MTLRAVISVLLALTLALAAPFGLAAQLAATNRAADPSCTPADTCPCCEGTVCPCVDDAPVRGPEAPFAPRPTSDLRIDIAPVPLRTIVPIALPIAVSGTKPVARSTAMREGVRLQAAHCTWRT